MSLRKPRAVAAPSPEVEVAAEDLLRKGNAVDAVVAGVFAACATSPGVLLGPVQLLVGGAGAGLFAIDGRVRQPGIGAPRPRGFVRGQAIPDAARVGVTWLPAALSVATATMGTATFLQVCAPAVALAKGTPRAEVLRRIASRGARALEERPLGPELLAAAGRPSGGLLTSDDLASPRPEVLRARRLELGAAGPRPGRAAASRAVELTSELARRVDEGGEGVRVVTTLPWAHVEGELPAPPAHELDVSRVRAVAAVDRNATFAIACWEEPEAGLRLDAVGLVAPFAAEPVRRGQPRVRPGEPRPAAGPVALVGPAAAPDVALFTFGAPDVYDVLGQAIESLVREGRIEVHGDAQLAGVSHVSGAASALRA